MHDLFLRLAPDDSGLHGHGSVHHPVWLDDRTAGLLLGSGPHALRGWPAFPNGR